MSTAVTGAYPPLDICWMQSINFGLQWSQLVGCFFIFYCFAFAEKKLLWYVLFAHGLTGFVGILVESLFQAYRCTGNNDPNLAYLIAFNEINWIIFEASTVLYSYIKISTIITNQTYKQACNIFMIAALVAFAAFRINIGRLRFSEDQLSDTDVSKAHSYAFIVWGITDFVVFGLMLYSMIEQFQTASDGIKHILKTLIKSSLPRIGIVCINTFSIVIMGQLTDLSPRAANFNTFIWMVKGTYPIILLIDVLVTREMLMPLKMQGTNQTSHEMDNRGEHRDQHDKAENGSARKF